MHLIWFLKVSKHLVVDAYFSKFSFVESFSLAGFYVVCRLRDDADLRYLFEGKQKNKGRTRKYDGKIDFQHLNKKYAKLVSLTKNERIYFLKVNAKSLKRSINMVIVYTKNKKRKWEHKIYFSTDLAQNWQEILELYRLRFQIEFLYRDAKQHTGLNDCQARSEHKLYFHWNMALTAVNIAKIVYWVPQQDRNLKESVPFSMRNIKTLYNNKLLLSRFISKFGINPELRKNKRKISQLLEFGRLAT